jgi:hypothetical protein
MDMSEHRGGDPHAKGRKLQWSAIVILPIAVNGSLFFLGWNPEQRNREWPSQMQYSPAYGSQSENRILPGGIT